MLRAASDDRGNALGNTVTCWLLDDDPSILNTGAVDRLLQHVYQMSKVTREAQQKEKKEEHVPTIYQYEISVIAVVDYAVLSFGSAHTFTNPLFEVECTQVSISASTLLSQSGWFVPENEFSPSIDIQMASDNRWPENDNSNEVIFRSTLKVMYLNTKHDHMVSVCKDQERCYTYCTDFDEL